MNVQTVNFQGLFFINVSKPTDFEMKFLRNTYSFDPLNLEDYLHKAQIPKIENHKEYDLLILRFPIFSENAPENSHQYGVYLPNLRTQNFKKRRLTSSYVNFFIAKEYVVILHDGTLPQIENIFNLCQKNLHNRTEYMGKGSAFLAYKIIDALANDCFPAINEITTTIDEIDKELEEKPSQKTLEDISTTRRNLVVFHTMIKPILPLLKELEDGKHAGLNGSMQSLWGNVLDHLEKIWDRVEDNQELIEGISRSNESLLSSRNNEIVKFLTVITSIAFPFVVINNLYSMNVVGLPYAQYRGIVYILFGVIFVSGLIMVLYFKFRKWL
jgi:magnesium transporter